LQDIDYIVKVTTNIISSTTIIFRLIWRIALQNHISILYYI